MLKLRNTLPDIEHPSTPQLAKETKEKVQSPLSQFQVEPNLSKDLKKDSIAGNLKTNSQNIACSSIKKASKNIKKTERSNILKHGISTSVDSRYRSMLKKIEVPESSRLNLKNSSKENLTKI